jgi:KDO2-lipid IV(A) lauroyltransferase
MSTESRAHPASAANLSGLKPTLLGSAFYYLLPVRRGIVLRNLRLVFGERLDDREIRLLARCYYSHFFRSIVENLAMLWTPQRRLVDRVAVVGVEHLLGAAEQGKGILLLTGHFGNWELASIGAMLQFGEYRDRFHVIRKSLSAGLEQLVFGRSLRAGLKVIPRFDALGQVMRVLEKNDVAIFIMDQHTKVGGGSRKGVAVDFFGRQAGTNRSLALLAAHTGAPVVPATAYRRPDGKHVMEFEPALEWIADDDTEQELRLNTRRYNEVLERFVLAHPEQWFWMHRRWKLD